MDDLLDRYFEGDLDAVELSAFEESLDKTPELAARFADTYDVRTSQLGFRALAPARPELSECFSPKTLERYVARELAPGDHALVAEHECCPWCAQQIRAFAALAVAAEKEPREKPWIERVFAWLTLQRRPFAMLAAAAAAVMLIAIWIRSPSSPALRGPVAGVEAKIVGGERVSRLVLAASDDRFVGVVLDGRWVLPDLGGAAVPPNLIALAAGATREVELAPGAVELSIVISQLPQNTAVVAGVLPEKFEVGETQLSIDGRPRLLRLRIGRGAE